MRTITSSVVNSAVSVEMNEEEIIINGKSFVTAPTIRDLTEIFQSTPSRHPKRTMRPNPLWNWIWDDVGIIAEGQSEITIRTIYVHFKHSEDISMRVISANEVDAVPDEGYLPANAFSGSFNIYGVDVGQANSFERLEQCLTPMNADFRPTVPGGPTEIIKGNHICLQNHRVSSAFSGQPSILYVQHSGVAFNFPSIVELPAGLQPMLDERVLGQTRQMTELFDCITPPLRPVKSAHGITKPFQATVSNRRLVIVTGHSCEKLLQWSMNDINNVIVHPNVDALSEIPVANDWFRSNRAIRAEELSDYYKPPYHVLEIATRSTGRTSFIFRREIHDKDCTLPRLLDLEDCIKNAISRYRGKVPDLPLAKEGISDSSDANERSATAEQDQANDKLIPCPRCTNRVSPEAVNCPFCGQPIAGGLFRINRGTHEKTPKFVKVSRPLGWLLLILSGVGFMADMLLGDGAHYVPWIIGACLAICLLVYMEVGQWWHQG